jgi:hypothetical protein
MEVRQWVINKIIKHRDIKTGKTDILEHRANKNKRKRTAKEKEKKLSSAQLKVPIKSMNVEFRDDDKKKL